MMSSIRGKMFFSCEYGRDGKKTKLIGGKLSFG